MSRSRFVHVSRFALLVLMTASCGQVQVEPATENTDTAAADALPTPDVSGGDAAAATDTAAVDGAAADQQGSECATDFDCVGVLQSKNPCQPPICDKGLCKTGKKPAGTPCVDSTLSAGECQATQCSAAGVCAIANLEDGAACGLGKCGKKCAVGLCVDATTADYDDKNPCTKDYCNQGFEVRHDPVTDLTIACDDDNQCTVNDACLVGKCQGVQGVCSDGVACTMDVCDPKAGCKSTAVDPLCDDANPCTVQVCDPVKGCVASAGKPGVPCDDGNSCTAGDACAADGTCGGTSTCACTTDADCATVAGNPCLGPLVCVAAKCQADIKLAVTCDASADTACAVNQCDAKTGKCGMVPAADGKACEDGNSCTSKSACGKGECVGAPDLTCSDNNPCTDDSCAPSSGCVYTPNLAACSDDNACTSADKCFSGGCVGVATSCDDGLTCTFDTCDAKTGKCISTPNNAGCDDANPCTADSCAPDKGCVHAADDAAKCEDGDACTTNKCVGGQCAASFVCQCKDDAGCDDKNPCTADSCVAGVCKNDGSTKAGTACDTGDKCQLPGSGVCAAGVCTSGNKPVVCPAAGACLVAACNPSSGKCESVSKADGTACDADGNGCTADDKCSSGTCTAGGQVDCSSQAKTCFIAQCKSSGVNSHTCELTPSTKGSLCDDGKYCTTTDSCDGAGACVGGPAPSCAAQNDACNTGICVESLKACSKSPKAATVGCDDGLFCTTADHCDGAGKCAGGPAPTCSGGNCLDGYCDSAANKCATKPSAAGTACTDGSVCTTADKCDATGKCAGGTSISCDDKNPCTVDSCDAIKGCVSTPSAGVACDDANACTTGDKCDATGKCASGTYTCQCKVDADCNDGNACTTDKCVSGSCSSTAAAAGTVCDDKNACTLSSVCSGVTCTPDPTKLYDCSAQNDTCNVGTCYDAAGAAACKKVPKAANTACDDGLFCTLSDACDASGKCVGGPGPSCGKPAQCFTSLCLESAKGCTTQPLTKGTACSDGNPCTAGDACDGVSGCMAGPALGDFTACDDGVASTTGDICYTAKCAGFSLTPGPSMGPATRIRWQTPALNWQVVGNDAPALDETVSGSWKVFPSKASGATTPPVWGAGVLIGTQPVRAMSDRVILGNGNSNAGLATGSTAWAVGGLGKGLSLAVAEVVDWTGVDQQVVGGNSIVTAVGRGQTSGAGWLVQCSGADTSTAVSCAATKTSGITMTSAQLSTSSGCLGCATTAVHNAVGLVPNPLSGVLVGSEFFSAAMGNLSYTATAGPGLSAAAANAWTGLWVANSGLKILTGSTTMWMVGPSGLVAYSKVGTAGIAAATIVAAQTGYQFRSVDKLGAWVLIFGTKPDSVNKLSRRAVLLAHYDTADTQSGTAGWTEIDLGDASPAWPATACSGNMMGHTDMQVAQGAVAALANVCSGSNVRRPVIYYRSFN